MGATTDKSTSSSSGYDDVLTTHEYDGIQEYDNPMPGWWTWIFIGTVVWAGVYYVGLFFNFIPDYDEQLAAEMTIQRELEAQAAEEVPPVTPEMLAEAANSEAAVAKGSEVYTMNCAACHGQQGEGLIGPNLADNAWIHGPKLTDIHQVVAEGVTAKGMPAWSEILQQQDVVAVVAYVDNLRGTTPPNPKPPEGEVYSDSPADGDADDKRAGAEPSDG